MSTCVISGHWSELERQDVHFSFHSLVVTAKYDVSICIYYNWSFDISEHFLRS